MDEGRREGPGEVRRDWRVHGRVQGVGFRWWTVQTGRGLGLRGCVGNLADGTVVVRAAGPRSAVDRLGDALARGPAMARVERVESIAPDGDLPTDGFHVSR